MKKQIDVVGAVIERDGLILCAQRGPHGALAGMWEFPGGKIEPGELPEAALRREIDEELNCTITVGALLTSTTYEYDFGVVTLTTYRCELAQGEPTKTEHESVIWLSPAQLDSVEWAPADLPAVAILASTAAAR